MPDELEWAIIGAIVLMVALPGWAALWVAWHGDRPTYTSMEQTIGALSEQVREMHGDMARLQAKVAELTIGVRILTAQLMGLGASPEYVPAGEEAVDMARHTPDVTAIHERLVRSYSIDEMDDLAFGLGVPPEELGEDTLSGRARALIQYMQRREQLPELLAAMNRKRPKKPNF